MKITGFLLLLGGWIIVLAAIALLPSGPSEVSFVLVALGSGGAGVDAGFSRALDSEQGTKVTPLR